MTHRNLTGCDDIQEILSAKLDAEAQPDELALAVEHLEHCTSCARYESDLKKMKTLLRESADVSAHMFDCDQLWRKVQQNIDRIDSGELSIPHEEESFGFGRWLASVAVAACLIIGITVGSMLIVSPQQSLLPVVAETVRDFETFRMRGELLDVDSGNDTEVVQWMSAKLDFTLPDTIDPPQGYQIAGGRLCSFLNRRLAFFQYQKNADSLALYVMKAEGLEVPSPGRLETSTSDVGLTTVTWVQDDLVYVIVSEMPIEEVAEFALRT